MIYYVIINPDSETKIRIYSNPPLDENYIEMSKEEILNYLDNN